MLIADDEPDMRALIAHILRAADFDVVGEAADSDETVALWRELRPDVIVLDQRMPPTSGLVVAETILAEEPRPVVLLFTAFVDIEIRTAAQRLGIAGCIAKKDVFEIPELVRGHLTRG